MTPPSLTEARSQDFVVTTASPPAPEAARAENLGRVWARAEATFPVADGYGIECGRHAAGFYHATISRRWESETFAMIAYETSDAGPQDALNAAIVKAERNLGLGIDWRANDLPKGAAQ